MPFISPPQLFISLQQKTGLQHRHQLPNSPYRTSPSTWRCGLKKRKKPKQPGPVSTRPKPSLPELGSEARLLPNIARPQNSEAAQVRKALQLRKDVLILGQGVPGKISAALSRRERSEHGLVLVATREDALRAKKEASLDARGSRVIVAAGVGYGSWGHPALNANSSTKSVIVIGTPRAVVDGFLNNGHGRPWLGKVRFLMVVDLDTMVDIACVKHLKRVLKPMKEKTRRKNVVVAFREPQGAVKIMTDSLLREKTDTVLWGGQAVVQSMKSNEIAEYAKAWQRSHVVRIGRPFTLFCELGREISNIMSMEGKVKMVVFFQAARLAECYATMCRRQNMEVIDIHSKTSVCNRERGLDLFFRSEKAVLFSSDTITRNTLLPSINRVVQIGLPKDRDHYLRRIALIKEGTENWGLLLVTEDEAATALRMINEEEHGEGKNNSCKVEKIADENITEAMLGIREAADEKARQSAYQSWLAYYIGCRKRLGWTRPQLIEIANDWAMDMFGNVPEMEKKAVTKMRLIGREGIRIEGSES